MATSFTCSFSKMVKKIYTVFWARQLAEVGGALIIKNDVVPQRKLTIKTENKNIVVIKTEIL